MDSNGWDGSGNKSGDDCDDADDTIYPTAPEHDGLINQAVPYLQNEVDDDSDGYVECDFHNEGWDGDSGVTLIMIVMMEIIRFILQRLRFAMVK